MYYILESDNLEKVYGKFQAINNLNMYIEKKYLWAYWKSIKITLIKSKTHFIVIKWKKWKKFTGNY